MILITKHAARVPVLIGILSVVLDLIDPVVFSIEKINHINNANSNIILITQDSRCPHLYRGEVLSLLHDDNHLQSLAYIASQ